ncbi:MAG TPA: group III truncated hemoglobin [Chryseosolibacter sp.]
MKPQKEIEVLDDIKVLVDTFYAKVREDNLLKDIFDNIIKDRWPEHLEKMYRFWQTVLLGEHTYHGSPFVPHAKLPVDRIHFDRWLELFYETVDGHFQGEKALRAKWQGDRMAEMFLFRMTYYRENPTASPIR